MRNREDFESLVFERAEEIKARDRAAKTIRMTLLPVAAAFLVLTAVGIRRFTAMPASLPDAAAPASGAADGAAFNAPKYDENTAAEDEAAEDAADVVGEAAPQTMQEEYLDENDGAAAPDEQQKAEANAAAAAEVTVTFAANDKITLVGKEAGELADALGGETTPVSAASSGYIGRITVEQDGTDTDYYLYPDHFRKTEDGTARGEFALSDATKSLIQEYFGVQFRSK